MRSRNSLIAAALVLSACAGGPRAGKITTGYDEIGVATWYGDAFAGRPTASGARFDPAALTAAHRTLPLGSLARVRSLVTGRSVLVLINDRGPRDRARLIDLSRAAAEALGPARALAQVEVTAAMNSPTGQDGDIVVHVDDRHQYFPDHELKLAPLLDIPSGAVLQVAAFTSEARARALAARLGGFVEAGGGMFRVRLGPFATVADEQRARDAAARAGYADAALVQPN